MDNANVVEKVLKSLKNEEQFRVLKSNKDGNYDEVVILGRPESNVLIDIILTFKEDYKGHIVIQSVTDNSHKLFELNNTWGNVQFNWYIDYRVSNRTIYYNWEVAQ